MTAMDDLINHLSRQAIPKDRIELTKRNVVLKQRIIELSAYVNTMFDGLHEAWQHGGPLADCQKDSCKLHNEFMKSFMELL